MSYTDLATVKSYLGETDTLQDALLTAMIASAQAIIDAYCKQTFESPIDSTRYLDALCDVEDGRRLWLGYPLCAVTTVTNGDGAVVAPTAYVTEPRNGSPWWSLTLKSSSGLSWTYTNAPENAIVIVGKWGYSLTAPEDIQQAALRLTAYLFRQRDNGLDIDRIQQTAAGIALPVDMPRDLTRILAPYRRVIL